MDRKRILVVDSQQECLEAVECTLRPYRSVWELCLERDVQRALDRLRTEHVDVLLVSLQLAGDAGFWLVEEMRRAELAKHTPIVGLVAAGASAVKQRALELDRIELLTTPIEPEELVIRLRAAIRLKSHQEKVREHNYALERQVRTRTRELENSQLEIVWRLANVAEYHDEQTGNHVARVGCYSRIIAETIGLDPTFVEHLFLAAPLHDIGKIGIPDTILLKPGALTSAQWTIMKQHCLLGKEILEGPARGSSLLEAWRSLHADRGETSSEPLPPNPILNMAATIALTHHEKWNGQGYPLGLSGDRIPLESRIVAVADVFDALTSKRPYKEALSEKAAVEIVQRDAGSHFDPGVVRAFAESLEQIRAIRATLNAVASSAVGGRILPAPAASRGEKVHLPRGG